MAQSMSPRPSNARDDSSETKRGKRRWLAVAAVVLAFAVVLAGLAIWRLGLGAPPTPPVHDIVLTDVGPNRTLVIVGDAVTISTRIENQGNMAETTTVTATAGAIPVGSRAISLGAGKNQTLAFDWDTSGLAPGRYPISAEAAPVAGELDTADNALTDGTVTVELPPVHDMAVISVAADKLSVSPGETVTITAVVQNQGTVLDTTTATAYAGTASLGNQAATLAAGASATVTFTWDTTGVAPGSYPVRAEASVVPGETDTGDNLLADGTVTVSATKNPGVLVIASIGDPQFLDPAVDYEVRGNEIIKNVYDRLVRRQVDATDPSNPTIRNDVFVGSAAIAWTVSPDERTWNFTIRQGMAWHDPRYGYLDAYDVEYSIRRVLRINIGPAWILDQYLTDYARDDPLTPTDERWNAINASVVATDPRHVELRLARPYGAILATLDSMAASIVSRRWVEDHGGTVNDQQNSFVEANTMGTGPYELDHWTPGVELKLVRNANYWGTPVPSLEAVLYTLEPEAAVQEQLLRNGDVDWAEGIPTRDIRTVMTWPGVVVEQNPSLVIQFMGLVEDNSWPGDPLRTVNTAPLQDIHVRKAVSYAFDYDLVLNQVLDGWGTQLRSGLPQGMPGWNGGFWNYNTNIATAQAALAQAAPPWNAGGFTLNLSYNSGNPVRAQIATMVQATLVQIGITVNINAVSWPQHLNNMDFRLMDLVLIGWAPDYLDPDDYLYPLFHSAACPAPAGGDPTRSTRGTNVACYRSLVVDRAIEDASRTAVWQYRLENYTVAQQHIVQDSAWVFMYQPTAFGPIRDWVKGYYFDPMEFRDFLYLFK